MEKYRPRDLDQVVSQSEIIKTRKPSLSFFPRRRRQLSPRASRSTTYPSHPIRRETRRRSTLTHARARIVSRLIDSNAMPHLLFYGPPGTGKTSTALACARRIYGADSRAMLLEVRFHPSLSPSVHALIAKPHPYPFLLAIQRTRARPPFAPPHIACPATRTKAERIGREGYQDRAQQGQNLLSRPGEATRVRSHDAMLSTPSPSVFFFLRAQTHAFRTDSAHQKGSPRWSYWMKRTP